MSPADLRSPFAGEIARALAVDPTSAPLQPAPPGIWSGLGGAVRDFVPAALGETARTTYRAITASADDVMRRQQQEADDFTADAILRRRVELDDERQRSDVAMRDFVQRFTPDAATTGAGSQVVFGLGKTLTKAIPAMMVAGPVGGAAIVGGLEGGAEMQRLEDQGVDPETAGRAGLVTGAVTAVGFGLPAFGTTLARTAGLVAAGGPGSFMAQQAAVGYILDSADYSTIAQQYDPFDPVGLAVSTVAAGAFGAAGMAAARRGARVLPADPDAEPAARSVALSDQAASAGLHAPDDLNGAAQHLEAIATAGRQMDQGRPVDVADRAPAVDQVLQERLQATEALTGDLAPLAGGLRSMYVAAARAKPAYDAIVQRIADEVDGAVAVLADLKGVSRASEKVKTDYNGDVTQIKDLVRGTVEVRSLDQAQKVIDLISERFIVLPKGQRNLLRSDVDPVDGYRDAKFNVLVDGHVAELQVNVPAMLEAKGKVHDQYARRSAIERESAGRERTKAEQAEIDRLNAHMKSVYAPAWASATSALKADQPIGAPLRRADSGSKTRGVAVSQAADENGQPGTLPSDTGIPSTSKVSTPLGAAAGSFIEPTSTAFILPKPQNIATAPVGAVAEVVTERGLRISVRYKVVDAADLVTSHDDALRVNESFPAALQPRDRTRAASEAQIAKIEGAIDPELLAASRKASDGAPVIGADGVVESGNARTIALRRAYGSGRADAYRAWLVDNADRFGLKPAEVDGIERPVLVRETAGRYNRAEFARQANEAAQARLSAPEQAKVDAQRMPDLDRLVTNEDGTINVPQSREFIRDFFDSVVSPSELNDMIASDGRPSAAGLARIRNALFSKAYGDAELVAMLTESTDANIRNVLAGLMRAAPDMAKLRDNIAAGARQPMDFAGDVATAARQFSRLRSEGTSVEQFLGQGALIDSPVTPEVAAILRGLAENARSAPKIADMVQRMVGAVDALGDPRQGGMFDVPAAGVRDVAEAATGAMREEQAAATTAQQSIELQAAREAIVARPDLQLAVAEGESVPASQLLEQAAADAAADRAEAAAYQAAVACFLRG